MKLLKMHHYCRGWSFPCGQQTLYLSAEKEPFMTELLNYSKFYGSLYYYQQFEFCSVDRLVQELAFGDPRLGVLGLQTEQSLKSLKLFRNS